MLFIELRFFLFFGVVLAVSWGLVHRHRAHKAWLLAASYVFYGAWDWRFLSLILISTAVDYLVGRQLGRTDPSRRKRLLAVSLVGNLGLLGAFKYLGFFKTSVQKERQRVACRCGRAGLALFAFGAVFPLRLPSVTLRRARMERAWSSSSLALLHSSLPSLL